MLLKLNTYKMKINQNICHSLLYPLMEYDSSKHMTRVMQYVSHSLILGKIESAFETS